MSSAPPPLAARFDVAVIPRHRPMRVAPKGLQALVRWMMAEDLVTRPSEVTVHGVLEVRADPGVNAHHVFDSGESDPAERPPFHQMVVRAAVSVPAALGYGPPVPLGFFLELRGAARPTLGDDLLARLDLILLLRPEVVHQPHTALRPPLA